ncbi:hypothetical protein [Cohnella thailandensis]|uniref:Uncharacterized protein n=1 Tax=Cohnella thailandensis TaxID=557557 RepID=A0A841SRU4_9BACL|nr:hypothetical protein [Cohnella thailandensis]MBB6632620.1 hypothetical protein [Cohnella thailandensis]MBP1975694.1 signal recognition particle subunit SEC65 [Cohnella thailandensis]
MKKYQIRFFFEYGGGCLWGVDERTKEKFGYYINPEDLPLSKETIDLINELEIKYQTSLDWEYPPNPSPWSKQEIILFKTNLETLIMKIKNELIEEFEVHNELNFEGIFGEDINFT